MSWVIVPNADKTWSIRSEGAMVGPFDTWAEASKEALAREGPDEPPAADDDQRP